MQKNIASGRCGDNAVWSLDSAGCLSVEGTGPLWNVRRNISQSSDSPREAPKTFENFSTQDQMVVSLVIHDGITDIGDGLFAGLTECRHLVLPDTLENIGNEAFRDCGFFSVTLPKKLRYIGAMQPNPKRKG